MTGAVAVPQAPELEAAPVRVVLVDDSAAFLAAIQFALSRRRGIDVLGTARDVAAGLYLVRKHDPQVAVVDVRMPGQGGVGLTREIRARHPAVQVVALTVSREEEDLSELLRAGACGYVLKSAATDELPRAIHAALRREAWVTPEMTSKLVSSYLHSASTLVRDSLDGQGDLTGRERAVLGYVAQGRTNKEIGDLLYIAETTVKTHLKSIFAKLEVRNRSEAAAVAWRMGLGSTVTAPQPGAG
jgi:two-component system nitrate/nitrite response regulator NarL